ncbi:hypothetical protein K461DRAFT_281194, partial [Myriangium duriaei CBS 260.36]
MTLGMVMIWPHPSRKRFYRPWSMSDQGIVSRRTFTGSQRRGGIAAGCTTPLHPSSCRPPPLPAAEPSMLASIM